MSIQSSIADLYSARNSIRSKMMAANQAKSTDKLSTLAYNLKIGVSSDDATATSDDILSGKTAYVDNKKITGTMKIATRSEVLSAVNSVFA